jgi:hypothetical protein
VHGSKILSSLNKEVKDLSVYGDDKKVMYVLEGLLLSSYQYLRFFKDASKKVRYYLGNPQTIPIACHA